MTLIRNDEIQASLVARLKANTTIVALLNSSDDIKEVQSQSREFNYPAVRVRLFSTVPVAKAGCANQVEVGILVFSEQGSSYEADRITGIIGNELHDSSFVSSSLAFHLSVTNLIHAYRRDERTWQAEVILRGTVTRA